MLSLRQDMCAGRREKSRHARCGDVPRHGRRTSAPARQRAAAGMVCRRHEETAEYRGQKRAVCAAACGVARETRQANEEEEGAIRRPLPPRVPPPLNANVLQPQRDADSRRHACRQVSWRMAAEDMREQFPPAFAGHAPPSIHARRASHSTAPSTAPRVSRPSSAARATVGVRLPTASRRTNVIPSRSSAREGRNACISSPRPTSATKCPAANMRGQIHEWQGRIKEKKPGEKEGVRTEKCVVESNAQARRNSSRSRRSQTACAAAEGRGRFSPPVAIAGENVCSLVAGRRQIG